MKTKKKICLSISTQLRNGKRVLKGFIFACQSCSHISIETLDDSSPPRSGYSVSESESMKEIY